MFGSIRVADRELRSFRLSAQSVCGTEGGGEANSGSRQFRSQRRPQLHRPGLLPARGTRIQTYRQGTRYIRGLVEYNFAEPVVKFNVNLVRVL